MLHTKVDLNLFVVLCAIYENGSITAAAKELCLTQPAVSHALGRLREKFSDPLFERRDKRMYPTERCVAIIPQVQKALASLNDTLDMSFEFDITQHQKSFNLGCRDILEALFFPKLMTSICRETEHVSIASQQVRHEYAEQKLVQGELDIVIDTLFPVSSKVVNTKLGDECFSLVCSEEHPIAKEPSLENYLLARHVVSALKHSEVSLVDTALTQLQKHRNIALHCESFYAGVRVVAEGELIMTMPNSFALQLAQLFPIKVLPLPFAMPSIPVHMYWNGALNNDPLNKWLRAHLIDVGKEVMSNKKPNLK